MDEGRTDLAKLFERGRPVGPTTYWSQGKPAPRDLTLVTAKLVDIARVEGLSIDNWGGCGP